MSYENFANCYLRLLRDKGARLALVLVALLAVMGCSRVRSTATEIAPAASALTTTNAPANTGAQTSYADVVARVAPAVVTVRAEQRVRAAQQHPFVDDPFFRQFFGDRAPREQQQPQIEHVLGSGVIVTPDGYILTNHHVVDGAENIKVDLSDRRTFDAKVIGSDPPSDLAVLKINATNLPVLNLGDSDRARVGDVVLAIGNPLGLDQTVTAGIVSAKGRATGVGDGNFEDFIQTDAPINQGNSGGALINTNGELVGINSQILSPSGGSIGIGFAIPSNMAKGVMDQLIKTGKVRRGQLGVGVQTVTSDIAQTLDMKNVQGVIVSSVVPGSAGERAGLKQGDVITALNGQPVNDSNSLRNRVASAPPGSDVTLNIVRDGREQQVKATLGEFKPPTPRDEEAAAGDGAGNSNGMSNGKLGLRVEPLTPDIAQQLGLPANRQGVVVADVDPTGPAADAGLERGDVIEQVNRVPVHATADVTSAVARSGARPVLLLVTRVSRGQANTIFVTVRPRA
ncbi:MAG TPA: DegQ family serine endoprotease, partial [Pyrinomonadaceae bacterium]|nr:DegQ family serine endoprotease [Pyrinomonadaceae bacterium]